MVGILAICGGLYFGERVDRTHAARRYLRRLLHAGSMRTWPGAVSALDLWSWPVTLGRTPISAKDGSDTGGCADSLLRAESATRRMGADKVPRRNPGDTEQGEQEPRAVF